MHTLFVVGLVCLGLLSGGLLLALLRAQRTLRVLADRLAAVSEPKRDPHLGVDAKAAVDTLKDEFVSTVSHELRTPLTSIRGSLGLLSSGVMGTLDPKAAHLLRIAVTNTDRLIRLINDILDLERMESGRAPLQVRRCSLQELAEQAADTMSGLAHESEVHIDVALTSGPGCADGLFFDGDSDRILQVLTNLLSNAIKFSPHASTVRLHAEATSDSILLKVSDEGRGIPADKLDTVFERFGQVEHSDTKQKNGTGLGLAICRTIIQQHSGSIWAQRNLGSGSTFCVMLPRTARATDVASPAFNTPRGEGQILVCDDDPGVRTVVREHLARQGYDVLEAASGLEAVDIASRERVEAILLDLYMPGMSGWETLQRLRDTPATSNTPVVVLSVLSPVLRAQLSGEAQGWVQKPFNENLLFAELGRVLRHGEGPARVLLVEDDEDLASVVVSSFAGADVRIEHAATRQQAIRQCLTRRPDLLILDLTLPDGDGFSLVEWLREQPGMRSLPLVVYSGREVSEGEMKQLRLGPTEFLTKAKVQPREVEELVVSMVHRLRKLSDFAPPSGAMRQTADAAPTVSAALP